MSNPLAHFGLDRAPFADESPAVDVIGTRALRKVVARIQAALRDGRPRIAVHGPAGIGKTCLAAALPKLFAGHARVATIPDPELEWRALRSALARSWQLDGERLSRTTLLAAAGRARLVLLVDRAEQAPESLLGHLDVLQSITGERETPLVTTIFFLQTPAETPSVPSAAQAWLERHEAVRLAFEALTPEAVADYIQRKLRRAGQPASPIFTPRAALAIHAETAGIPGAVSRLCGELLEIAAARRLRSIDEPFVRSRGESANARATLADETGFAWDDADHHPRETPGEPRAHASATPRPAPPARARAYTQAHLPPPLPTEPSMPDADGARPRGASGPGPTPAAGDPAERLDEASVDPALEAYLSAPPTEAELRAIRGGFLRRFARPFLVASLAVAVGGVLLALWMPDERAPAMASSDDARSAASESKGTSGAHAHQATATVGRVAEIDGVVLGRLRGPVEPAAVPIAAQRSHATPPPPTPPTSHATAMSRAAVREDEPVPIATHAAEAAGAPRAGSRRFDALARGDATLRRARDFPEAGSGSASEADDAQHPDAQDAKLREMPDLRPAGLRSPAGAASPDL